MIRTPLALLIVALALTPLKVLAQVALCGDPPPVANDTLKGDVEGQAELLSRFIGDASLSGKIETSRTQIFSEYKDSNERWNAYFQYQVCIILMSDDSLTSSEKIEQLTVIQREFAKPILQKDGSRDQIDNFARFEGVVPGTTSQADYERKFNIGGKARSVTVNYPEAQLRGRFQGHLRALSNRSLPLDTELVPLFANGTAVAIIAGGGCEESKKSCRDACQITLDDFTAWARGAFGVSFVSVGGSGRPPARPQRPGEGSWSEIVTSVHSFVAQSDAFMFLGQLTIIENCFESIVTQGQECTFEGCGAHIIVSDKA